jgi:hypothetical protein
MSSQVLTRNTEAQILARVIEADETEITPDGICSPCNFLTPSAIGLTNFRQGHGLVR